MVTYNVTIREEPFGAYVHLREGAQVRIVSPAEEVISGFLEEPSELINEIFEISPSPKDTVNIRVITPSKTPVFSLSAPYDVSVDVTNICNLSCKHCYASALHSGKHAGFMDLVRILSKLDSVGVTHLAITGGEPFLHPELDRIIRYIYLSTKLNFTVLTNGTIFREDVIDLLSKVKEVGGLFISLDDVDSESHDEFRGTPGAWERTVDFINRINKTEIPFIIGTVIHRHNRDRLGEIIKFSKDLGADGIHFMVFTPAGRASKVFETYGINKHEVQKIQLQLEHLVERYSTDTFKVMLDDFGYTFTWEKHPDSFSTLKELNLAGVCAAGRTILHVDNSGNVYPCSLFLGHKEFIAGNLLKQEFYDIWLNSEVLNNFRSKRIDALKNTSCSKCKFFNICKGGCAYNSYAFYGTIFKEDPLCPHIEKIQMGG
ncbi:radical SAM/SPASM domain-containing protein [Thermococcus peptonophilus]|uniref:Radical SAM core domain-containing protein n=1 Tax=Thermococcus peptonophilus TaxID=53952 RepID=A0A142CTR0_9EURY|nr:radical SAM protein [Thermococcus peptonophilus]AMQ18162.1 hypothetical protein A0127_02765 [Thermococcus peptonophilus]